MRYYGIVIAAIGIDQATKLWVRFHMHLGETLVIWQDVLHFTYYRNSGAAGSTFQGYGRYFIIPAVLFVLYMAYARKQGQLKNGMAEAGAALLVGGAIGNAIDRAVFGWVTDFVDNGRGILNLADIAIQVGVLLLLADAVRDFIVSRRGRKSNPLT
ncbi:MULTISPECIES: signal peptidase II [Paenibacillus]|uniref:Lipoprotein signal peptidase n=2 Tax=Paenibacillus TaxID=44249 RepID=A0A7X3CRW2_9BACL|nr:MULTISPECIES: signal peptidase II [Paenibacillus]MUG71170.1 signal peptidase II [Paenibacillus validus]